MVEPLKVKVGEKAPIFCLLDKDENEVCLNDFIGKWVVFYFYPKDNTKGCTIEAIDNKATAHVCINRFCKFPTSEITTMLKFLEISN